MLKVKCSAFMKRLLTYTMFAFAVLATAVLCCACGSVSSQRPGAQVVGDDKLIVRFIDVGQGDASLISCGDHHMLIDGGDSGQSQKMYSIMKNLGISQLDAIVATHSDADHIGGISGALNYASTQKCYCSVTQADTKTFQNMVKFVERSNCSITVPEAGDSFMLGEAVVTFVGPVVDLGSDNNNSLVVRIDFGQTSFLFMGDAETEAEDALLKAHADVQADALKVAHHGSRSSSSLAFLKRVAPQIAVVSVGDNTYGHPTDDVLSRLESIGAEVLRTDQLGTIFVESDGAALTTSYGKLVDR